MIRRSTWAGLMVAVLVLCYAKVAFAAAGDLDTLFSGDGKVTTLIGSGDGSTSTGLAIQSDRKIVVAGGAFVNGHERFALARYNPNGSLDPSFSGDGRATTPFGSTDAYANAVAIEADGNIVAAGGSSNGRLALARYNPNGSLDTTFSGDGKLRATEKFTEATGVAVQTDDKIVTVGNPDGGFQLRRYNTNGSLDTTFSGDGKVNAVFGPPTSTGAVGSAVAIQADGKIVAAGGFYKGTTGKFALVRYNSNGTLDTTFSGDGKVTTMVGTIFDVAGPGVGLAIQPDGRIVAAADAQVNNRDCFAVVRYNADGSLDSTFSGDGKQTTSFGSGDADANAVAIQTDGKIVVAGLAYVSGRHRFALARYKPNGSRDLTFSGDGKLTTLFGSDDNFGAWSLALQTDGKIVADGYAVIKSTTKFAVARYLRS